MNETFYDPRENSLLRTLPAHLLAQLPCSQRGGAPQKLLLFSILPITETKENNITNTKSIIDTPNVRIINTRTKSTYQCFFDENFKLHRENAPAVLTMDEDFYVTNTIHFRHGVLQPSVYTEEDFNAVLTDCKPLDLSLMTKDMCREFINRNLGHSCFIADNRKGILSRELYHWWTGEILKKLVPRGR